MTGTGARKKGKQDAGDRASNGREFNERTKIGQKDDEGENKEKKAQNTCGWYPSSALTMSGA